MITVNVKQLIEAIEEADVFKLPDINAGTDYLYNNLYKRLSYGDTVRMSDINFDNFELDDVDNIRELHSDVLGANEQKTEMLARSLRELKPATVAAAYV